MELITMALDPLGRYQQYTAEQLRYWLGDIPRYFNSTSEATLKEQAHLGYGLSPSWNEKMTVDDDGVYHYPEDPDLYPVAAITRGDERFYIYPYGLVAYVSPEYPTGIGSRMD